MSVVRASRRGVTTAVHTDDAILHPAAMLDFNAEIRRLLAEGQHTAAEVLWASVFEVVHAPAPFEPIHEFATSLPRMRRIPCTQEGCRRCTNHLGGFQFPWLGLWTKAAVVVREGSTPEEVWGTYYHQPDKLDLLALQRLDSGHSAQDLVPPVWDSMVEHCISAPGCAPLQDLFEAFRVWNRGHRTWQDPHADPPARVVALRDAKARSQRSMAAWLDAVVGDPGHYLPASCFQCGGTTRRTCGDCMVASCEECEAAGDEDEVCCEESLRAGRATRLRLPAVRCGETMGTSCGGSFVTAGFQQDD